MIKPFCPIRGGPLNGVLALYIVVQSLFYERGFIYLLIYLQIEVLIIHSKVLSVGAPLQQTSPEQFVPDHAP